MASVISFLVSPYCLRHLEINNKHKFQLKVHNLGDSTVLSSDSSRVNGASFIPEKEKNGAAFINGKEETIDGGNGKLKSRKLVKYAVSEEMQVLWDDGYGTKTVKDYLEAARDFIKPDGGPPRWFCPLECGKTLKNSPVLLFLPGLDGVGLGLTLHQKALGKVFEVRCLHIPVYDRTPFEGLVKFVEETVRLEHASFPNRPIYLVGDSFGGCLALAIAARNPNIDLVLVLANPATSFGRSQLQPIFPVLENLPDELHNAVPYLLSGIMGNPLKMAMADVEYTLPPGSKIEQISENLTGFLPHLSGLANILPKESLIWKLKLLKSAAAYTNSRLHAVKAEVLVLASGNDYMLPSKDEAVRLGASLQNCTVRHFKDNGHTLLLEDGISLLTIIKGTCKYRRSRRHDFVADFVPPSKSEFNYAFDQVVGGLRFASSSAMFSTLADGKIVRGLAGVPSEGPVLLVGYHMLMGMEVYTLVEEFLRQKNIMIHVPVTPSNLFKLLSTNSHVLLYPGGAREALHYKGEAYKLIWPEEPEFVRMAARFGATIVPFGCVGEDDILDLVLDYNDLMKIPVVNDLIRDATRDAVKVRDVSKGEVANEELFIPGVVPKIPGRIYALFGKPIETKGKEELLKDREYANEMYLQVKSQVESNIDYLLKKREKDPFRGVFDRTLYRAFNSSLPDIPAFDP
ncbi:Esterase/lipase/thioesterase family protein [Euphorbia peplus]|nr:Esterase/lipase/thioesterase family protein [Euphorbia peplus]